MREHFSKKKKRTCGGSNPSYPTTARLLLVLVAVILSSAPCYRQSALDLGSLTVNSQPAPCEMPLNTTTVVRGAAPRVDAAKAAEEVKEGTLPRPKYQKYDWPGVSQSQVGHPLVAKGTVEFIDDARRLLWGQQQWMDEFLQIYQGRPDKTNMCGMRINHSLALFLAIKVLQPTSIIENGVNAGHSTYIMRSAAPHAKLYPIDPLDQPICGQNQRWMDPSPPHQHQYYTGRENFQDFTQIDWGAKIQSGEIDPQRTLVLLDDHLDPSTRYPTLLKYGFRHILFEDNYKPGKGATPGDRAGWLPKQMFSRANDPSGAFFWQIAHRYAEFPPLVPPIMAKEYNQPAKQAGGFLHATDDLTSLVPPLLRPDVDDHDKELYHKVCAAVGVNPSLADLESYMQMMNYNQFAYLELTPLAPRLLEMWPKTSNV